MRSPVEAVLALLVVLTIGTGLFLFTGEPLGDDATTTTAPVAIDPDAVVRGEAVANSVGCFACHTVDGTTGSGPTWKGLAGSSRPLESGEVVTADETYLLEAIIDPTSQVVAGFDAIMPASYGDQLTDQEIADLIQYIRSLS